MILSMSGDVVQCEVNFILSEEVWTLKNTIILILGLLQTAKCIYTFAVPPHAHLLEFPVGGVI